jgi:tetratricopeptide (TPR) repeat protein
MSHRSALRERIAGKWQIPLFMISLLVLAGALLRINPQSYPPPLEEAVEILDTMVSGGVYDRAIALSDRLLRGDEYMGRRIVAHYQQAKSRGQKLTPRDFERIGRAHEWQRDPAEAVTAFQTAIEHRVEHRAELLQHVIRIHQRELGSGPELLDELLCAFQAEVEDHRLALRLWGIEQQLDVLEALGRIDEAATLLMRHEDRFHASDLRDRFDYAKALLLYKSGHYDEAETFLRTIRNRVDEGDEVHAMTGWLLGRVVLSDGAPQRPLEALSFFSDVITHHLQSPYTVASRVGQAEALAYLERHDEAISTYRRVLDEPESLRDNRLVNLDVLRTSLGVMAEAQRQAGHLAASLEYARLVMGLVDRENTEQATMYLRQLARALALRAAELNGERAVKEVVDDSITPGVNPMARGLFAEAAAVYLDLAKLNTLDERRSAEWSWHAAELYGKSGDRQRAIELYQLFATERPGDPLVPRANLRIAQLYRAMGRLPEAIAAYQECYRRFPRTLDGSRALVPLAECYLAVGPGNEELAEKALDVVLTDSDVLTPQAPEFADALFLLGDVLNRRGDFERAIATLEEALERYGDDPRVCRARYLIADSYRQSALALRAEMEEATFAGELEQMRMESAVRFRTAQALYRQLIREYEVRGRDELDGLERLYYRHAMLYEADCWFETGDYDRALKLYEEAAGTFKDSPASLAAYVQIINCHVFLGQTHEARAALARAQILVDALPESAFARAVSPETQDDWRRYLAWMNESGLF